ncbi:MAG: hypothetical protein KAR40_09095 [Candidatus Sabulitectum sp.]|nr:hypothetical protein [Candidatus Sabulitectum sp.]
MIFLAAVVLLGMPDPMDIHAGDFLDLSPREALNSGAEAYRLEDWHTAAAEYLNALVIDPGNSNSMYNLACCYGLMGEDQLTTIYLKRACVAGFTDLEHINRDPDFDSVRELPAFSSLLDSLNAVAARQENKLGEIHWFDTVESFYYRVQFPDGFNPPGEVPVVIGLHGLGSSPDNFIRIWEQIDNPDFIFVVPQAPYPIGEDAFSWYRGEHGTEEWGHSLLLASEYVLALVEQIKLEYPVSDVYLFGFSQGGCLALYTGLSEPELFKAVIPASGWLAEDFIQSDWITDATTMQIELMHSPDDRGVPFEAAEIAEAVLSENGWDIKLHQTSGAHMVDMEELVGILSGLGLTGND